VAASTTDDVVHLIPDSFTSPLLDSDSVKAAQNPGTPSTYASSGVVRPVTYPCGEYTSFKALAWTEWTPQVAVGPGIYTYNTSKPDCASANYRSDPSVTLSFEDPKIVCGQWFFTRFEVKDTANPAIDGSTPIAPDRFSDTYTPPCLSRALGEQALNNFR
jgi:hypothetical protein